MLNTLCEGSDLTTSQAEAVMDVVFDGDVDAAQVAGILVALRAKGETADELTGMVRSMLGHATRVTLDVEALDIVGTGGDDKGSVNISTMAAFVIAGAGQPVCKHGNRAASSKVGTADVLEALGVKIECSPEEVAESIAQRNFGFCFAPAFHPAMRFVGPVRKALGIRTAFNVLGPLANPAQPPYLLVGTADPHSLETMATVLGQNGVKRAWVVHARDGYDELSTSALSDVVEVVGQDDGTIEYNRFEINPASYSLTSPGEGELLGGDATVNARALIDLLEGASGAVRDIVLLNAAAGLVIAGRVSSLEEGILLGAQALDSGAARGVLSSLVG